MRITNVLNEDKGVVDSTKYEKYVPPRQEALIAMADQELRDVFRPLALDWNILQDVRDKSPQPEMVEAANRVLEKIQATYDFLDDFLYCREKQAKLQEMLRELEELQDTNWKYVKKYKHVAHGNFYIALNEMITSRRLTLQREIEELNRGVTGG